MAGLFDMILGRGQQQAPTASGIPGMIDPESMPVGPMLMMAAGQALSKSLNPAYGGRGRGGDGMQGQLMDMWKYKEGIRQKNLATKMAYQQWQRQIDYFRSSGNEEMAAILEAGGPQISSAVIQKRAEQAMNPQYQLQKLLMEQLSGVGGSVPIADGGTAGPAPVQESASPIDRLMGRDVPAEMEPEMTARVGTAENISTAIDNVGDDLRAIDKDRRDVVNTLTKEYQTQFMAETKGYKYVVDTAKTIQNDLDRIFAEDSDETQIAAEMLAAIKKYNSALEFGQSITTAGEAAAITQASSLASQLVNYLEGFEKGSPIPVDLYLDLASYVQDLGVQAESDMIDLAKNYQKQAATKDIVPSDVTFGRGIWNVDEYERINPQRYQGATIRERLQGLGKSVLDKGVGIPNPAEAPDLNDPKNFIPDWR